MKRRQEGLFTPFLPFDAGGAAMTLLATIRRSLAEGASPAGPPGEVEQRPDLGGQRHEDRPRDAPADPCLACETRAWRWERDWPVPGEGRWLCGTCCDRPMRLPTLHEVRRRLSEAEHTQLANEAAAGHP